MAAAVRPTRPVFHLVVASRDSVRATIRAVGELDLAAKDALTELLGHQRDAGRVVVRLDVSKVTFIDCSCLHVLVDEHERFLAAHGLLVLTGLGPDLARLLKASGFDNELFTVPAKPEGKGLTPAAWLPTPAA